MEKLKALIVNRVALLAVVATLFTLLREFGVPVTVGQSAAITAFLEAVRFVIDVAIVRNAEKAEPATKTEDKPTTRIVGGLLVLLALLTGCAALRSLNDARKDLCDLLGEDRREAIEAEAKKAGISPVEALTIFKATCLIRLERGDVEAESLGAIRR